MSARRDVDWLEFHLVLTTILTRATHERALIGHREPDSGVRVRLLHDIEGEIAIETLMADPHGRSRTGCPDLVPGAPRRELRACPF